MNRDCISRQHRASPVARHGERESNHSREEMLRAKTLARRKARPLKDHVCECKLCGKRWPVGRPRRFESKPGANLCAGLSGGTVSLGLTRPLPQRSPAYLAFVRRETCLLWRLSSAHACQGKVQAHHPFKHLLWVSAGGIGRKGSDWLAVPLCYGGHHGWHTAGRGILDDATVLREVARLLLTWFLLERKRSRHHRRPR